MMDAEQKSMWSTCKRLHVGTVIVDFQGSLLSSGYNGAPYNIAHCQAGPDARCTDCCHSETNAINQAAKLGIMLQGSNLYTLYRPCDACSKNIIQAGIGIVYYRYEYNTDNKRDYVLNMFKEAEIHIRQLDMTEEEYSFRAALMEWRSTWDTGSQDTP